MTSFIIDLNVPIGRGKEGYPDYFFDEMNSSNKHHVFYGGKKYMEEVRKKEILQRLLKNWSDSKKATRVNSADVDTFELKIHERITSICGSCPSECDDIHIIALAAISKCENILTYDKRMSRCKDLVRHRVGHRYFPNLKFVKSEATFRKAV